MPEVTEIPVPVPSTSVLKKIAKRSLLAALAVGTVAAVYVKTQSKDETPSTPDA